jgi:hypothetical protein
MNSRFAKFERFLGRVFIVLLASLVTIIAFELLYRAINKTVVYTNFRRFTSDTDHVQKPYVMFTAKPNPSSNINILGYKGALPTKVKPKGEYRVFFLGGSVLFYGNPNFLEIVSRSLPENVKIFNLGVPSSVSRQELIRVLLDVAGYQPDLIVSFSGYNDMYDTGWDPRINYPHRFVLYEANPALKSVENYELLPVIALKSKFVRDYFSKELVGLLVRDMFTGKVYDRNKNRNLIADAYIQNLRLTNVLSKHLGADFISFFQPTLFFKECFSASEKEYLNLFPEVPATQIRSAVTQAIKPYKHEFTFYDLSELFKGDCTPSFKDYVHLTDGYAQEKVANHILAYLKLAIVAENKKHDSNKNKYPKYFPEEVFVE